MVTIRTQVDALVDVVKKHKSISISRAAGEIKAKPNQCLEWAKRLNEIIEVKYSINLLKKATLSLKEDEAKHLPNIYLSIDGQALEKYQITVDGVPAEITIIFKGGDSMRTYYVGMPDLGIGTGLLLKNVIRDLAVNISTNVEDLSDPLKADVIRDAFRKKAEKFILDEMPVTKDQANLLAGIALHRVYGLDDLEIILGDDKIEEICINSAKSPIIIYHRGHGWLKTNIMVPNEENVFDYAARIGRRVGKDITNLNPLMDARLLSGDRVMASMYPISMQGNTITIRKFARDPWTIIDFIDPKQNTLSAEIAAFLWMCIQYELSILVAGGTASGKTSMLNSLAAFVPPGQRIISIEDTREIQLPSHLKYNWIQLTTRNANPDGLGEVNMLNLIISSLRMRPDRIIVGEIRDRDEAEVLFEAMHTGHSVYSTMHADTCQHVRRRVTEPPIEIPEAELEALEVIVTQYRDRLHGKRRTFEIAEVIPGTSERKLELNYLYRWRVKKDNFEKIDDSIRVFNDINLYTGLSNKEIDEDLSEKRSILEWMIVNKLHSVDDIGRIMNLYYTDKEHLMDSILRKKMP